jgi:hypothetical protein
VPRAVADNLIAVTKSEFASALVAAGSWPL